MAGRRPKAPAGTQWRGNILHSDFQIKGKTYRVSLKTDDPAIAAAEVAKLKKQIIADTYHGGTGAGPRMFIDVVGEWKTFMEGKPGDRWDGQVGRKTLLRYSVSFVQLAPYVEDKRLSQVDGNLIGRIVRERGAVVTKATVKRDQRPLLGHELLRRPRVPRKQSRPAVAQERQGAPRPHRRTPRPGHRPSYPAGPWHLAPARSGGPQDRSPANALISAKREDLDHGRKELRVVDKGNKVRVIDLKPMGGYGLFAGLPAFAGKPWLFWRTEDKRVRADSKRAATLIGDQIEDPAACFRREIALVVDWAKENEVEFRPFTFHELRHKHAIVWLREGGNIYELQQRLGHSSIKQTEEYLKYVTPDQQRENTHGERKTA